MKSCLIILALACVAVSGEVCFKDGEFQKKMEEKKAKFVPVAEKCKAEGITAEDEIKKCVHGKVKAAMAECRENNTDHEATWKCASDKLGIECDYSHKSIHDMKAETVAITLEDKKIAMKALFDSCNGDKKQVFMKLVEKCDEVKAAMAAFKED